MTNDQAFRDAQRAYADKLAEDAFFECNEDRLALYGFFGTRINARPDIVNNPFVRSYMQNIVQYVRSFQERQSLRQAAIDLAKPGSERTAIVQMQDGKQVKIFVAEVQKQEPIRGRRMIDMDD